MERNILCLVILRSESSLKTKILRRCEVYKLLAEDS